MLSDKELELFERLMNAQGERHFIHGREFFVAGVRLEAKVALELMDKNDGCIIDILA